MVKNIALRLGITSMVLVLACQVGHASSTKEGTASEIIIQGQQSGVQEIILEKELLYDKHKLDDTYPYNNKTRSFQWDKIKQHLLQVQKIDNGEGQYAVISNYKNKNGEAPLVAKYKRNNYKRIADTLGTERYQSVPLYATDNKKTPVIYGRDGSLVSIIGEDDKFYRVRGLTNFEGEWDIPKKYVKPISAKKFEHVVVVDNTNQNIATIEHQNGVWKVRSMNPATTGRYNPPFGMRTPTGTYVMQEKKPKMFYYKDGTTKIQGYAPWASRFTNGAYIHGVPTTDPNAPIKEYSSTLGTIPRSHMCVRNASSHAKFIYDWMQPLASLVIVID